MKKNLRITVKGHTYDVIAEILDDDQPEAPRTASSASAIAVEASSAAPVVAPTPKATSAVAPGEIPSPISGTVMSIVKPVGSIVAEDDVIMVLEAMKMNTEVTSPSNGKVTAVNVAPGETVDEGQVLMTLA